MRLSLVSCISELLYNCRDHTSLAATRAEHLHSFFVVIQRFFNIDSLLYAAYVTYRHTLANTPCLFRNYR